MANRFDFCGECKFYECELVKEYEQFAKSHYENYAFEDLEVSLNKGITIVEPGKEDLAVGTSISEIQKSIGDRQLIEPTAVMSVEDYFKEQKILHLERKLEALSYDKGELKNGCIMDARHVVQVECNRKTVADGIGEHYKIIIGQNHKIKTNTCNRWNPRQAVIISAQTGQGKNYFVEKVLIPYVKKMNYENKTAQKVLIISNRLALKCQVSNRLRENDGMHENDEGRVYHYKGIADVITYQSILCRSYYLENVQKNAMSRYIYVICDEAHFFTSDAMFNPYTQKILSTIITIFQEAVRIYMSATPYESLEYIKRYGETQMILYHFQRDYSYLDINIYSEIEELYGEIVKGVARKEKWLIFIDDKEKCQVVKRELEAVGEKMNVSIKDSNPEIGKIYVVNADSKNDAVYNSILDKERLGNDIDVLITTSVLDNGVNLRDVDNIIVSNMSREACIQMVGRARVNGDNYRKNLYIRRFNKAYVRNRIYDLEKQEEAYHEFELAYGNPSEPYPSNKSDEYKFLKKYYDCEEKNWNNAKHWFGRLPENPNQIYPNVIAKSLTEKYLSRYRYIYQEMEQEQMEIEASERRMRRLPGQKYLEYQLSWFDKQYCAENDITLCGKTKAEALFTDFLDSYIDKAIQIKKEDKEQFKEEFTKLYINAFGREDKNQDRTYAKSKMNKVLQKQKLNYQIQSTLEGWEVVRVYADSETEE